MERKEFEHLMTPAATRAEAYERLSEVVEILRVHCPWDRVQTRESLRPGMIEEAYEVCEAIDTGDVDNLREELGDVMLQVVFHSMIADENGEFSAVDVINEECEKMIRRHPHVFLEQEAKTVDKVLEKWENIKVQEHGEERHTDRLTSVPKALPALIRARKVQKRAADIGFDWDDPEGAFEKLTEETRELKEASLEADLEHIREELGDLLFSVVNVARFLDVDPENALERATEKFTERFGKMEDRARLEGKDLKDMSLSEMDDLWDRAKAEE
jgi:tetrapyrrole methylase family protein/MazG family protein